MKHNLGYKYEDSPAIESPKKEKKEVHYPEFSIGSEYGDGPEIDLPQVEKKGVGAECKVKATLILKEVGSKKKEGHGS